MSRLSFFLSQTNLAIHSAHSSQSASPANQQNLPVAWAFPSLRPIPVQLSSPDGPPAMGRETPASQPRVPNARPIDPTNRSPHVPAAATRTRVFHLSDVCCNSLILPSIALTAETLFMPPYCSFSIWSDRKPPDSFRKRIPNRSSLPSILISSHTIFARPDHDLSSESTIQQPPDNLAHDTTC